MNKSEAREKAIDRVKGQEITPGTIAASRLDPLTWRLLRYEGEMAVCEIEAGKEVSFPKSEIFDVKKVINVANHYLNLGFWEEGMESMIVALKTKGE